MPKTSYAYTKYLNKRMQHNSGEFFTITRYYDNKHLEVTFDDGTIIESVAWSQILKGNFRKPNIPSIYNIGYVGQGIYRTDSLAYRAWYHMFYRCYDKNTHKCYNGCSVSPEWHNFQKFAEWYETYYVEDYELDKDLLIKGNKVYGPETCCFLPKEINCIVIKQEFIESTGIRNIDADRVYRPRLKKFGKEVYLGTFQTQAEAFQIYKMEKESYVREIAEIWKNKIPEKAYEILKNYVVEISEL